MAIASRASLDAAPLLEAEFEEKRTEGQRGPTWRSIDVFARRIPIRPILASLRPSFLHRASQANPPKSPHPTAWLDGLRGIAAFFVFIYHFQHLFHRSYQFGYASNGGKDDYWLIQLPIIRLIFTGGPMVSIFWVLSGISLSLKPIQLARGQAWDKFFDTMFSSVFRRMLRLYLPVLAVQVCVLIATCLGMYNHAYALSKDWPFAGGNETQHVVKESNLAQIADWAKVMWALANPFNPTRPVYDVHLWTIPFEFRNSIILFATLVGFAKLKSKIRVILTSALWAYCVLVNEGDVALFIAGMGLAEYLLIRDEHAKQLPSADTTPETKRTQDRKTLAIWSFVCFVGLWLLSWPSWNNEHSPGYMTLYHLTPPFIYSAEMTWSRIGAAVFLLALCGCETLCKPFKTPVAIYMGKISFPLYIVHGPLNHIIGIRLVEFFWSIVGNTSLFAYETGVVFAFLTEAVMVVWLADIVMRTVDTPSVRFGRWLQTRWSM